MDPQQLEAQLVLEVEAQEVAARWVEVEQELPFVTPHLVSTPLCFLCYSLLVD